MIIKGLKRKIGWLAVILAALTLQPAQPNTAKGDSVHNMWLNGVRFVEDRNIEKYAVNQVQPPYPVLAQKYRIEGIVTVEVRVDHEGRVAKADFVRGHSIFRSVSLEAARQWQFHAPPNNSLEGTINFSFRLRD